MIQYGVAALEKDMPFPSDCALSWIIRVALNPSILPCWTTSSGVIIAMYTSADSDQATSNAQKTE